MKTRQPIAIAVALVVLVTAASGAAAADRDSHRWTSLGQLHVQDRLDRDTLRVGVKEGTFDAIRIKALGRAVQFHSVQVHFENETVQDVSLRSVIPAGGQSRVIDLKGGRRAIEKIVFVYDAQTRRRGKGARIRVYGRR